MDRCCLIRFGGGGRNHGKESVFGQLFSGKAVEGFEPYENYCCCICDDHFVGNYSIDAPRSLPKWCQLRSSASFVYCDFCHLCHRPGPV